MTTPGERHEPAADRRARRGAWCPLPRRPRGGAPAPGERQSQAGPRPTPGGRKARPGAGAGAARAQRRADRRHQDHQLPTQRRGDRAVPGRYHGRGTAGPGHAADGDHHPRSDRRARPRPRRAAAAAGAPLSGRARGDRNGPGGGHRSAGIRRAAGAPPPVPHRRRPRARAAGSSLGVRTGALCRVLRHARRQGAGFAPLDPEPGGQARGRPRRQADTCAPSEIVARCCGTCCRR